MAKHLLSWHQSAAPRVLLSSARLSRHGRSTPQCPSASIEDKTDGRCTPLLIGLGECGGPETRVVTRSVVSINIDRPNVRALTRTEREIFCSGAFILAKQVLLRPCGGARPRAAASQCCRTRSRARCDSQGGEFRAESRGRLRRELVEMRSLIQPWRGRVGRSLFSLH